MRKGNLLFSAVQFMFALLVILLGFFLIGLQKAPYLRQRLSLFFSDPSAAFLSVGFLVLGCGFFLLVGFLVMYRGRYYQVKMGSHAAYVDVVLIEKMVADYWRKVSPDPQSCLKICVLTNQQLEFSFELPDLSAEERESLFNQVESELGALLYKQLGYNKEFIVSAFVK